MISGIRGGVLVSIQRGQRQRPRARCSGLKTSIVGIGSREKKRLRLPSKSKPSQQVRRNRPPVLLFRSTVTRKCPGPAGAQEGIAQRSGDIWGADQLKRRSFRLVHQFGSAGPCSSKGETQNTRYWLGPEDDPGRSRSNGFSMCRRGIRCISGLNRQSLYTLNSW